jgi:HAD superfamily phosphoserine phosphatase-like hydrolase
LRFENDYGVDIGLLIDSYLAGARVAEVDIGSIEHRSRPLDSLGEMATQVARTVLERAASAGRLRLSFIRKSKESERLRSLTLDGFLNAVPAADKIALFDMDGVLLNGRFIVALAEATNKETDLSALLDNFALPPRERMKQIAAVFTGVRRELFESVAREIPLMPGVVETINALRRSGYKVGIVTDSYYCAAETVRRRVFADFCFSHTMQFKNGRASGRVNICPAMIHADGCAIHDHCKVNVLKHLSERFGLNPAHFLAVGDGENDVCMLREAGCSVAFRPKTRAVRHAAQNVAWSMSEVLRFAMGEIACTERFASAEEELEPVVSN